MRSASAGGIAHHWGIGSGPVVVGRWIRMVKQPQPRPAVVLMHHDDECYEPSPSASHRHRT